MTIGGLIALTGAGCRRPDQRAYPSVNPVLSKDYANFDYYRTAVSRCGLFFPLRVKTFEGKPIFISPDFDSEKDNSAESKYTASVISELYNLYNPNRFFKPEKAGKYCREDSVIDSISNYLADGENVMFAVSGSLKFTFRKLAAALSAKFPNAAFYDYLTEENIIDRQNTEPKFAGEAACFVDCDEILNSKCYEYNPKLNSLKYGTPCFRLSFYREETPFANVTNIPKAHFLECWSDLLYSDKYRIAQPAIAKLNSEAISEEELIFALCKRFCLENCEKSETYYDYLKSLQADEKDFENCVLNGKKIEPADSEFPINDEVRNRIFTFTASGASYKLAIANYGNINSYEDYRNPFLRELRDSYSGTAYYNIMSLDKISAGQTGIKTGDIIALSTGKFRTEIPAAVTAAKSEFSAQAGMFYGTEKSEFAGSRMDGILFSHGKIKAEKTGRRVENIQYESNYISGERLKYLKNIREINNYSGRDKIEYYGKKYGLLVDVNKCSGCGACTAACRIENNIAIVGAENIEKNRDLDWISILRASAAELQKMTGRKIVRSGEHSNFMFIPYMCQHCENAPCEIACPVNAATHSPEGLNETIYNRCIGTRYCMAACQYKVRKFNFGDYRKNYPKELTALLNPRVTVRSRGVVEKCSLCIQRINEFDLLNENEKQTKLPKTACQEVCPQHAIQLIDINSEEFCKFIKENSERLFNFVINSTTKPSIYYIIG